MGVCVHVVRPDYPGQARDWVVGEALLRRQLPDHSYDTGGGVVARHHLLQTSDVNGALVGMNVEATAEAMGLS